MLYKILAHLGFKQAQFEVGADYFYDKKDDKALHWLMKAAEQGHVPSYSFIASIYKDKGHDYRFEYFEWLQKGVDEEYVHSLNEMAYLYRFGGKVTHKDTRMAIELYRKAAGKGSSHAKMMLDEMQKSQEKIKVEVVNTEDLIKEKS